MDIQTYRDRLEASVKVFRGHKKAIFDARVAFKQILPESMLEQASSYSEVEFPTASRLIHPGLTYIVKKFVEDLTALPPRYEWQSNNPEGEIAREALEREFRNIYSRSDIPPMMDKGYYHALLDGLIVAQAYTRIDHDIIVLPDGSIEELSKSRLVGVRIYDPVAVHIDPNCDGTDIAGTSEYIIVTIGVFDREYIAMHYPEYFEDSPAPTTLKNIPTARLTWMDDGEFDTLSVMSGRDKTTTEQYKVREYYDRYGHYYTVINDSWISAPRIVGNGIFGRIPFIAIPTMPDVDNPMGNTLLDFLRVPITIASRSLNTISDNTEMNNNMPYFTFAGSGVDSFTMTDMKKNVIVPLNKVGEVKAVHDMIHRPAIPEVTQGVSLLLAKSEQFMYLLAGTSESFITGQQDPQLRTDGIARMMHQASVRSQNSIARKIEQFQNNLLWDWTRIFYIYYGEFNFGDDMPREFLKNFNNIRVVPGSYLPEDQMSRIERAQTVLQLATSSPRSYELTKVHKDFLKAIGVSVPDAVLKGPREMLMEEIAMATAQQLGEGVLNDAQFQAALKQLADLAATSDEDMR